MDLYAQSSTKIISGRIVVIPTYDGVFLGYVPSYRKEEDVSGVKCECPFPEIWQCAHCFYSQFRQLKQHRAKLHVGWRQSRKPSFFSWTGTELKQWLFCFGTPPPPPPHKTSPHPLPSNNELLIRHLIHHIHPLFIQKSTSLSHEARKWPCAGHGAISLQYVNTYMNK